MSYIVFTVWFLFTAVWAWIVVTATTTLPYVLYMAFMCLCLFTNLLVWVFRWLFAIADELELFRRSYKSSLNRDPSIQMQLQYLCWLLSGLFSRLFLVGVWLNLQFFMLYWNVRTYQFEFYLYKKFRCIFSKLRLMCLRGSALLKSTMHACWTVVRYSVGRGRGLLKGMVSESGLVDALWALWGQRGLHTMRQVLLSLTAITNTVEGYLWHLCLGFASRVRGVYSKLALGGWFSSLTALLAILVIVFGLILVLIMH